MFPVPILTWKFYTAYGGGRVWKQVPCENCSTVYVYELEREAIGSAHETSPISTLLIFSDAPEKVNEANSSMNDTLQQYLENDFDPVPCPVCGHYQSFMFAKIY